MKDIKKAKQWLEENSSWLTSYLNNGVDTYSHEYVKDMFDQDPFTGYQVVSDYKNNMTDIHINQQRLIEDIKKERHFLLVGYKTREKAWWVLNKLKDEFNIKVVMPIETDEEWATPIPKQSSMPIWATPIPIPTDISEGFSDRDVIFYDELNIFSIGREIHEESLYESLRYSSRVIYATESRNPSFNPPMFNVIISESRNTFAYGRAKDCIKALDNPVLYDKDGNDGLLLIPKHDQYPKEKWGIVTHGKDDNYLVYMSCSLPIVKDAIHFPNKYRRS